MSAGGDVPLLLQFDVNAWSGELRRNWSDDVVGPIIGNHTKFTSAASEYFK